MKGDPPAGKYDHPVDRLPPTAPRTAAGPFYLDRTEDVSGTSGIGRVAHGFVFDDGTVVLRWLTEHTSTAIYASLDEVEAIHGHDGRTKIVRQADRSLPLESALRALVGVIAARPCLATEFYVEGYPEVLPKSALMDGVERCLDTEYNEMGSGEDQWPWDKPLERCDPCAARAALAATDVRGALAEALHQAGYEHGLRLPDHIPDWPDLADAILAALAAKGVEG